MYHFRTIALVGALCLWMAGTANAQPVTFFGTSGSIDTDIGGALIGFDNPNDSSTGMNPRSPTVSMNSGGKAGVEVRNGSTFNMNGGESGSLSTFENSTSNINGGTFGYDTGIGATSTVGGIQMHGSSTVNLNNFNVAFDGSPLFVTGLSTLNMTGGVWKGFVRSLSDTGDNSGVEHPTLNLSGGSITQFLDVSSFSTVKLSGVNIGQYVHATNHSKLTLSGGSIGGSLEARDSTTVTMSGGNITLSLNTFDSSTVANVSGGSIGGGATASDSTLNISGTSSIGNDVIAFGILGSANVSGGVITGHLSAIDSTVILSNGTVGGLSANGVHAQAQLHGGLVKGNAFALRGSTLIMDGGTVSGGVISDNGSTVLIGGNVIILGDVNGTSSSINMSGNYRIAGKVVANGGPVQMDGGLIAGSLSANLNSTVVVNSGNIGHNLELKNSAIGVVTGGLVLGNIITVNDSTLTMSGGAVSGTMQAQGDSTMILTGGAITGDLSAFNSGTVLMSGLVSVGHALQTQNGSTVIMSGGVVSAGIFARDSSTVFYGGGAVLGGGLNAFDNATIIWQGGVITGIPGRAGAASSPIQIFLHDNSTLEVDGVNLNAALLDPNSGGMFSEYQLTGFLADGTQIPGGVQLFVQNPAGTKTGATFQFVSTGEQWNTAADGSWGSAANWLPGFVPDGPGELAKFLGIATAPVTVTLDGDRTVTNLIFDNANSYTIAQGTGGTLFLNNKGFSATITVNSGHHQILAPVIAQDDTAAFIGDSNSTENDVSLALVDGITVAPGKTLIKVGGGRLSAAFVRGGKLNIQAGAVRIIPNGTSAGTSKVEQLFIKNGAVMDLADNDLIVQSSLANRDAQLATLTSLIAAARNAPTGRWTGAGLTTSAAASFPSGITGLAAILNTKPDGTALYTLFDGMAVDENSILIKYTYNGDMDLNGRVDADDYFLIDRGFVTHLTGYGNGDLDYSGVVDADDYFLIDNAFANQGGIVLAIGQPASAAVPEPSLMALALPLLAGNLLRRRR